MQKRASTKSRDSASLEISKKLKLTLRREGDAQSEQKHQQLHCSDSKTPTNTTIVNKTTTEAGLKQEN